MDYVIYLRFARWFHGSYQSGCVVDILCLLTILLTATGVTIENKISRLTPNYANPTRMAGSLQFIFMIKESNIPGADPRGGDVSERRVPTNFLQRLVAPTQSKRKGASVSN